MLSWTIVVAVAFVVPVVPVGAILSQQYQQFFNKTDVTMQLMAAPFKTSTKAPFSRADHLLIKTKQELPTMQ